MRRLFASRATSAVVAGILVLLVVGGGYGIAAVRSGTINACAQKGGSHWLYTGKCRKGDKKLSWNVKGPQGATGPAGATGAAGVAGATGATGATGAAGTARAYAYVGNPGASPAFEAQWTKNFTSISLFSTGVYCLTPAAGIDPDASPAVASVDWGSSGSPEQDFVQVRVRHLTCGTGKYEIRTFQAALVGGNLQLPAASNSVAYSVIVP